MKVKRRACPLVGRRETSTLAEKPAVIRREPGSLSSPELRAKTLEKKLTVCGR